MGHEWIIDVLADLKAFAKQNDFALLADQLDETMLVASAEVTEKPSSQTLGGCSETRPIFTCSGGSYCSGGDARTYHFAKGLLPS